MPSSAALTGLVQNIFFGGKADAKKLPDFGDLKNGDTAFETLQGHCAVMSSVSLTTATFTSSTEKLSKNDKNSSATLSSNKQQQLLRNFTRSYSLTSSSCSNTEGNATFKLCSTDRRFSLDDILDEKEEDVRPERTSSLSQLLDIESSEGDVRVEHRSREFVRQSSRTSSTETMSSGENKTRMFTSKKKLMSDISSSLSSLSKVTISKTSCAKSSQSAQNLHQTGVCESKVAHCPMAQQAFRRSKCSSPSKGSPSRPPQVPKPPSDKLQEDLDLLMKGQESPDLELAMGRIIARMDSLVDTLKSASSRNESLEVLASMNDLIRKSWAVSTIGYDLGSSLCKSLLNRGKK